MSLEEMAQNGTRRRSSLIRERYMTCPRCKQEHDVLAYVPLMMIEEYAHETFPIYKCPSCRWVFAPAPHIREEARADVG